MGFINPAVRIIVPTCHRSADY